MIQTAPFILEILAIYLSIWIITMLKCARLQLCCIHILLLFCQNFLILSTTLAGKRRKAARNYVTIISETELFTLMGHVNIQCSSHAVLLAEVHLVVNHRHCRVMRL